VRSLSVFNQVSLDGYFKVPDGDVSWTHTQDDDAEFNDFVADNAAGGGALLFGRKTYELMEAFWPTPAAAQQFPSVAKHMNATPKVVFSRTLPKSSWNATRIVKDDMLGAVRQLKADDGKPMAILGSGSIVTQLARANLIDEYQFLILPIVLGAGKGMFDGLDKRFGLQLTKTRTFRNGKVFLAYEPRR